MAEERPEQFGTLLREVVAHFQNGTFQPPPTTTFWAHESEAAFRLMAQARHIGKIAVRMQDPAAALTLTTYQDTRIQSAGTYLITGGLGGLGLSLAKWLVDQGARYVALIGRHAPNATAEEALRAMKAAGATVCALRADVTRRSDVEAIMRQLEREMPPVRGVVHAAGVLADRMLAQMSEEEFFRAIEPKVFGAWNLHEVTKKLPLDFFVMYSSGASLIGSPGQANYAAANAFLDALCRARVAEGLPGTSIQWGAFADVGMAAASDIRGKRMASQGSDSFTPAEGNLLFERVLQSPRPEIGLVRIDFSRLQAVFPTGARMVFLRDLISPPQTATSSPPQDRLLDKLERATPDERIILLEEHVVARTGQVLRMDPSRIDRLATFSSLGMDSLMSLELRNRIEPDVGVKLSATLLFAHPTPAALAAHLLDRLGIVEKTPPTKHSSAMTLETRSPIITTTVIATPVPTPPLVEAPKPPPAPKPEVAATDDDIEARLAAKLASLDKYFE